MKFSGPVQLCTNNFWAEVSDQLASRIQSCAENSLFLEYLSSPRHSALWRSTKINILRPSA